MNPEQNPQHIEHHAQALQSEIDTLQTKAQSSSGEEKAGIMNKIKELSQKKDSALQQMSEWKTKGQGLQDKAKGFMGKLGM